MLGFLFHGLTADPKRGTALFDAATAEARQKHWYVEGKVPDTIDGRFAVLATVTALLLVRLEQLGKEGDVVSVALTERFIAVMESEHRELGLGDPTLGKTVRKLVGSLSRRTELWRQAAADERSWTASAGQSLFPREAATPEALAHVSHSLRALWTRLGQLEIGQIAEGQLE